MTSLVLNVSEMNFRSPTVREGNENFLRVALAYPRASDTHSIYNFAAGGSSPNRLRRGQGSFDMSGDAMPADPFVFEG